ncbi:MAG: hypothetical protein WCL61_02910 [bacterium]
MFITVHAAAATIIGQHISSPILAFILGLISHAILDIIPHGDQEMGKKFFKFRFHHSEAEELKEEEDTAKTSLRAMALYGLIDLFALVFFVMYLFRNFQFTNIDSVIWAIIGGIIPDILVGLYVIGKIKPLKGFFDLHTANHYIAIKKIGKDMPLMVGMLMQVVIMITCVWMIVVN